MSKFMGYIRPGRKPEVSRASDDQIVVTAASFKGAVVAHIYETMDGETLVNVYLDTHLSNGV